MMVRLICGLFFYARSIYLYSRQWLHLFSLLTVSRRPLIHVRDMISKRVVTPAGKAFQALRRTGASPMGNGWFFRIWPITPAVGPYFCNKERSFLYRQKMKLEWLCLPIILSQENIITAGQYLLKKTQRWILLMLFFPVTLQVAMVAQSILLVLTIPVSSI